MAESGEGRTQVHASRKGAAKAAGPHPPAAIRVLCVDDHSVLIDGLRAQFDIDGGLTCVGSLRSAETLLDAVDRLRPDVVMLDIEMPGPDVFEAADRVRQAHPNQRFAFLSAHVRDGYLAAAYKAGAWGYFAKGDEPEDIAAGIKEIARSASGTFVMGPKVRARCAAGPLTAGARAGTRPPSSITTGAPATALASLSPRELEVLRLIGKGLSRTEIAGELSRSAKTVDGHQDRIMKKLGIDSRADLMRYAIREGLAEA